MIKKFVTNSVLLLGSLLIALVSGEFLIRWALPEYDPSGNIRYLCVDGAYRGEPNTNSRQWTNTGEYSVDVSINSQGFRDLELLENINSKDIFVVGDSFTFGQGVEVDGRYSSVLNSISSQNVRNLGIPNNLDGYFHNIEYAISLGATIKNVVIGITMENDLALYPKAMTYCTSSKEQTREESFFSMPSFSAKKIKTTLGANSALYSLISSTIQQNSNLRDKFIEAGIVDENLTFIGLNHFNDRVLRSSVNRIEDLSDRFNLVAMIIPSRGLWQGENIEVQDQIHKRFVQLLERKSINVLDLRPSMESEGRPLNYHFPKDGHWNEQGHKLAAKELHKFLNKSKLFE